ncbi:sensor histidine kinase [Rugosimonospora africana]|uniref:sensor histidine kinase n=1 Tax=Rugosimonospora africana TaxID=556532 RepID=UPI001942A3D8|nr:histidine kinase [Rugosimonospora africana]
MVRRLAPHPQIAPAFAVWIVAVILVLFPTISVANMLTRHLSAPVLAASVAAETVLAAIQLAVLFASHRFQTLRSAVSALVAQAVLVYAPFLWAHQHWVGTPYYLSASALLLLPAPAGRIVFACVVVTFTATETLVQHDLYLGYYYFVSVLGFGLAIFGLSRLADIVKELHDTRAELADLAVSRERLRFARDLHDLLSYSLSAISLTGELAYRLIDSQPAAAKRELDSVLTLSRQALTDVRAVANSYRHMSLATESAGAQAVLSAADIQVNADVAVLDGIAAPTDAVLATVLREAVTNVLRHSDASRCEIRGFVAGGEYRLIVANNGVRATGQSKPQNQPGSQSGSKPGSGSQRGSQSASGAQGAESGPRTGQPDQGGTGHDNLSERLEVLHGRLDTRIRGDGWFQLTARVPLDVRKPSAAA